MLLSVSELPDSGGTKIGFQNANYNHRYYYFDIILYNDNT